MRGYAPAPDASAFPGPPRAEIPLAMAASPGAAADAFELSGAPDQPVPQRLQFEAGAGMTFPAADAQSHTQKGIYPHDTINGLFENEVERARGVHTAQ